MKVTIQSRNPPSARRYPGGTPELVLLGLVVALALVGVLLGGGGDGGPTGEARGGERISAERIGLVQRRVERLRGLRFRRPVPVRVISAEAARRYGVGEERRTAQPQRERGQVEMLKLVGLLAPEVDVEKVLSAVYGEQVAGFYDTRRERLMLVRGAGVDEVTLAHELTHALEDQHFDLDKAGGGRPERLSDDAAGGYTALVEGTATEVMLRYMLRYPDAAPSLGDALGSLGAATSGTPLPPYVMRSLLFPYLRGQELVAALRHGEESWALVNVALRYRVPATSAEVLEPDRWLQVRRPARVPMAGARSVLGAGWRRAVGSTFGQFDTTQLLLASSGSAGAQRVAAGWDGGRYELWRRGGWGSRAGAACAVPCRSRDALVLAWRVERPGDAVALERALGRWLRETLDARADGGGGWRVPGGSAAVVSARGLAVRVALAPTALLAGRLAR